MKRVNVLAGMLLSAALLFQTAAHAAALTVSQRLSDFQQLNAAIDSGYGPLEYKKTRLKLDVEKLRLDYEAKIRAAKTNGDFFYLIRQYVAAYHDGHFGAAIPSRKAAIFPVMIERVEGKAIIDNVVDGIPPEMFPFKRGDQIVAINGRPVDEEIAELASYMGYGNPESEKRMGTWLLFYRPGTLVPPPPHPNSLSITVLPQGATVPQTVSARWLIQGEDLDENEALPENMRISPLLNADTDFGSKDLFRTDYFKFSSKDYWDKFFDQRAQSLNLSDKLRAESTYSCSGQTRISPPKDAVLVSDKPFVAYYHNTPYGKVGYLRVPHYMPQNPDGSPAIDEWFAMYEYTISVFEKNTVGMIIDQDHNCGGYISFANQFVGLFMDKPYAPIKFSLLGNKGEYLGFRQWVDSIPKNMLMRNEMFAVASAVKTAWQAGKALTTPISLDGKELLQPHHIHYTKPVVMLIDDMAGSGGDGVPAMMQGLGRAKLLGTQTASMGGHVVEQPPLNYSRITVAMTKSLFFRPDGTPIENNGAVPDYPYTITLKDFLGGYQDYQAYYLKVLGEEVLKAKGPALH